MDPLNFHHLRYFWLAAKEGSVSKAARLLRVSQPTASEQIHTLELSLGEKLVRRDGRVLGLTEAGASVFRYADDIFALGDELLGSIKGRATSKPARLVVGVSDAVPKAVVAAMLAPALKATPAPCLVCREGTPERLLDALATHAVDVVLADSPLGHRQITPTSNHLLAECGVSVFGSKALVKKARKGFPKSLEDLPFLLPTPASALRRSLDAWLYAKKIAPRVVGEFDDGALLLAFAEAGAGLFAAPDLALGSLGSLERAGTIPSLNERYYAITTERRARNPAVAAVLAARRRAP